MAQTINNPSNLSDIQILAFTPSTLLIPQKLLNYFDTRTKNFRSRKLYFNHLIVTYGRHLKFFGLKPVSPKWKKEYQKEGLGIKPRNFVPEPTYWEEFRHISLAYGLSMCNLFVVLLKLEHDRWVNAGSPENFCEIFSRQDQKSGLDRNSTTNLLKNDDFSLKNLVTGRNYTLLVRNIDYLNLKLDRIAVIRQE